MIQTRIIAYRHATITTTDIAIAADVVADDDDDDDDDDDATTNNTKNDKDDCRSGNTLSSSRNNLYCFLLEVTQKGQLILNPTEDTVKGPIRLRLVSSTSSSTS